MPYAHWSSARTLASLSALALLGCALPAFELADAGAGGGGGNVPPGSTSSGASTSSSVSASTSTSGDGGMGGFGTSTAAGDGVDSTSESSSSGDGGQATTASSSASTGQGGAEPATLLSLNKPASQSSNHPTEGVPGWCVDGIIDSPSTNNSVCITGFQASAWWQVDLGASHLITNVRVRRRVYCCPESATNFLIEVSPDGTTWSTFAAEPGTAGLPTSYDGSATGRFVRIRNVNTGQSRALNLNEVEVYGY